VYGDAATDFTTTAGSDVIIYGGDDGAIFRVEKKLDAPTIVSVFYIMWGKVEVTLKAAPGGGVVSSVVLQSDDLDEIDWEWIGSEREYELLRSRRCASGGQSVRLPQVRFRVDRDET
jgi:hypothetical protein